MLDNAQSDETTLWLGVTVVLQGADPQESPSTWGRTVLQRACLICPMAVFWPVPIATALARPAVTTVPCIVSTACLNCSYGPHTPSSTLCTLAGMYHPMLATLHQAVISAHSNCEQQLAVAHRVQQAGLVLVDGLGVLHSRQMLLHAAALPRQD